MADKSGGKGTLDRILGLFSDIRPGESGAVILMLLNIFLILASYYMIKTTREPLILLGGGAAVKTYSAGAQAFIMMIFIPLYGWFASKVKRKTLIVSLTLLFVINIEMFTLGVAFKIPYIGVAFYIWVGFFSVTIIAQFWSFANEFYEKKIGERLFPFIAIGMTAGSPVGAKAAEILYEKGASAPMVMHVSAAILLSTLLLYGLIFRKQSTQNATVQTVQEKGLKGENGFLLILKSKYLRYVALILVFLNFVNTNGEYLLSELATREAARLFSLNPGFDQGAYLGAFYGNFFFWVNIAAVLIQAFLVSRIVKYFGLAGALFTLPIVAFGVYGFVATGVAFTAVRWSKTAENSTDYSVMNTGRQLLWLPLSNEEKYKAKQAVDTFFFRLGDVGSAIFVFIGTNFLILNITGFALGNLVLILIWLFITYRVVKMHRQMTNKS